LYEIELESKYISIKTLVMKATRGKERKIKRKKKIENKKETFTADVLVCNICVYLTCEQKHY